MEAGATQRPPGHIARHRLSPHNHPSAQEHPLRNHKHTTDPIERLARRRAGAKMGWYIHASVYLLVNLLLVALSVGSGQDGASAGGASAGIRRLVPSSLTAT